MDNYFKFFDCDNTQEAWEKINEYLMMNEFEILESGNGGRSGPSIQRYNVIMRIDKAKADPNFDFGKVLGYKIQKWTSLLNNYLDMNYLETVAAQIQERTKKKAGQYSATLHFRNSHGSGKDCLVAVTFLKKAKQDRPLAVFSVRASEVTKRLLFDFLLVQRVIEFIYGEDNNVMLEFHAPLTFIAAENMSMYHIHKDLRKIMKKAKKRQGGKLGNYQNRILEILKKYEEIEDPTEITYKVHEKCAEQVKLWQEFERTGKEPDSYGLYVKDLDFSKYMPEEDSSKEDVTIRERKATKRLKKKQQLKEKPAAITKKRKRIKLKKK